jgi:vacuolar-type H+-ATPase subunit E/Vma4
MEKKEYERIQKENAQVICRKIKEDVEGEVNKIITAAKKEVNALTVATENEIQKKKSEILLNFHKESQLLKDKIFSTLTLEKKRIILDEKNRFIEEVFTRVKEETEEFRRKPEYMNFLIDAMLNAIAIVDTQDIDLLFSSFDEKIMTVDFKENIEARCRNRLNRTVALTLRKSDFNDIGIIAQSPNGHRVCDNRFLSRFKLKREALYMSLLREVL